MWCDVLSCVWFFATLWTVACQAPLSMEFSRQQYQSWLPFPAPGKWKWNFSRSVVTLCDPTDCSLPGSFVHGIFQARVLEWVAISFSRGSSQPRDRTWVSHIGRQRLYHLKHQGSPLPAPGDLPNPGIEPSGLVSPSLAGGFFTTESDGKPMRYDKIS